MHCSYICKFAGRRLPVASSTGTEHEHNDVQRSTGRAVPSIEPRLDERSVTDLGAISAQHSRDVTHLPGDREIREGHRDLMLTPSPTIFLLFCIVIRPRVILFRHLWSLEKRLYYRRLVRS